MVTLEQYRSTVGRFIHRHRNPTSSRLDASLRRPCATLVILLILLLCGDVESNPGPSNMEDILKKLTSLKQALKPQKARALLTPQLQNTILNNIEATVKFLTASKSEVSAVERNARLLHKLASARLSRVVSHRKKMSPNLHELQPENIDAANEDSGYKKVTNTHLKNNLLYEDDNLLVYMKRIRFSKQKAFAMSDYNYRVKIVEKDEHKPNYEAPRLINLVDQIHQVIIDIIAELKEQLDPAKHSQIYFCFVHHNFESNIPTGNYTLHANSPEAIANEVISQLASTLRSKDYIRLDHSFEIFVKALSVEHLEDRIKRQNIKIKTLVGSRKERPPNILTNKTLKSLVSLPDDDLRFKNKCLPGAILLGYYQKKSLKFKHDGSFKEEAKIYDSIRRINESCSKKGAARRKLLTLIHDFCETLSYSEDGPFPLNEFVQAAADALKIRVHVYNNQGNARLLVHPNIFDDRLPQIYLFIENYVNEKVAHASLILNTNSFFKKCSFLCNYCNQKRTRLHYCKAKNVTCFGCKRINVVRSETYIDQGNKKFFCLKLPTTKRVVNTCPDCCVTLNTLDCWKIHSKTKAKSCTRGFFCQKCKTYIPLLSSSGVRDLEELREQHICFQLFCRLCFASYSQDEAHFCRLKEQGDQKYIRPLAFFDLECYSESGALSCTECYQREQIYIQDHKKKVAVTSSLYTLLGKDVKAGLESKFVAEVFTKSAADMDVDFLAAEVANVTADIIDKHFLNVEFCSKLLTRADVSRLIQFGVIPTFLVRCVDHLQSETVNMKHEEGDNLQHVPNYCVLFYEATSHGKFNRIDFADPRMSHPSDLLITPDVISFDYLPDFIEPTLNRKKVRSRGNCSMGSSNTFPMTLKTSPIKPNSSRQVEEEEEEEEDLGVNVSDFFSSECVDVEEPDSLDEEDEEEEEENVLFQNMRRQNKAKQLYVGVEHDLKKLENYDTITKFLLFITNEAFRNTVFLSHNGQAYDLQFLAECCYKNGITPQLIVKDMRILQLTIKFYNLVFIDSINYVCGSLASLTKTFKLTAKKGFFPHSFNRPESYSYSGPCPEATHFYSFNDSQEAADAKRDFCVELRASNYVWDFKTEISEYCADDVRLLCQAMCTFLKQSLSFQVKLNDKLKKEQKVLHPFSDPFLTISGWVYGLWRYHYLPSFEIYALKDEKGLTAIPVSQSELEIVLYHQHLYPHLQIASSFTELPPMRFSRMVPDFFIKELNITGHVMGCMWHGHKISDGCLLRSQKWADDGSTNFVGETFASLSKRFEAQQSLLESKFNVPRKNQLVFWTCQWDKLKKAPLESLKPEDREKAESIRSFMSTYYNKRPLKRLAPRNCLRGGKVEAFSFGWTKQDHPDEELYYYDYNSLYPSVSSREDNGFPIGKPTILIKKSDLDKLSFRQGHCYLETDVGLQRVKGAGQVKILCPQMHIPFLQYRVKQGNAEKSISAICRTCAEEALLAPCQHSEDKRAFTDCWTLDEIGYALTLNYKLLEIYEVYLYLDNKPICKDFLETLAKYKIMYSGFPEECQSLEEREKFVDEVNKGMNWSSTEERLQVEDVEDNVALRNFFKLLMNSMLGKWGQDLSTKKKTFTVHTQRELDNLFWKEDVTICDWVAMSPYVAEVSVQSRTGFNRANLKGSAILAGHVTAYARIALDQTIRTLEERGISIKYSDTDSIIFAIKAGQEIPLPVGGSFHQYKNEIPDGEIQSFFTLGPKIYQLTYKTKNGALKTITKIKGFYLYSKKGREIVHDNLFKEFVHDFLNNINVETKLGQWQIKTTKKRQLKSVISQKVLKNSIFSKRVAFREQNLCFQTLPYGYDGDMFDRLIKK